MTLLIPDAEALPYLVKEFATLIQQESPNFQDLTFDPDKTEQQLRNMLAHPHWYVCISLAHNALGDPAFAGIIIGSVYQKFFSNDLVASDQLLYVVPGYRSEGHGQRLLKAFTQWATDAGAKKVFLGTVFGAADTLNADTLYARMGRKVGTLYALDIRPPRSDST